jgi:hypothetical protein
MSLEVLFVSAWVGIILIISAWVVPTANNWGPVADGWDRVFAPVNERIDRFGQLFVGIGSKENRPVHTFGGTLPIRGGIRLSDEEIYRVLAEEEGFLRGAVYNEFTGSHWKVGNADVVAEFANSVEAAQFGTAQSIAQLREPFTLEVEVVGDGPDRRLLVHGDALATDADADVVLGEDGNPIALVPEERLKPGTTYTTVGAGSGASISSLLGAGTDYPAEIIEQYTALPDAVSDRIYELGDTLTADASSVYGASRRVEDYLRSEFVFSLGVDGPPPGAEATEHFLFVEGAGYFDHFASAMTVLLRTQGIPARVAVGFVLDEASIDPETKQFILTEESAFAWTEVYFPGFGWVDFNPTPAPGRNIVARPGDDSDLRADLATLQDSGDFATALDDLLFEELLALEGAGALSGLGFDDTGSDGLVSTAVAAVVRVLTFLVIIGTLAVFVLFAVRLYWLRQFRELTPAAARWAKVMRLAALAGISIPTTRTPNEAMADLTPLIGEPTALRRLGYSYTAERYGRDNVETEHDVDVLDSAYLRVRARLWRMAVRRFLPLVNAQNQLPSHRPA